jgi:hypothetical protein
MTKTIEINAATGEEVLRDMTSDEQKSYNMLIAAQKAKDAAEAQAASDKLTAQAKLEALGLTSDDLKALGL